MHELPQSYRWLRDEPGPKMLKEALKLYGVEEKQGPGDNPEILAWARECGIEQYTADSIPWCGLFVAVVAKRAGKPSDNTPLWAKSWADWGNHVKIPELGDVLVFHRPGGGGHVGIYVGEDLYAYHVLGGNQGDAVSIVRIKRDRLITARNCYRIGKPANCRRVYLNISGAPESLNEK